MCCPSNSGMFLCVIEWKCNVCIAMKTREIFFVGNTSINGWPVKFK